jgi:hypothetical protein
MEVSIHTCTNVCFEKTTIPAHFYEVNPWPAAPKKKP